MLDWWNLLGVMSALVQFIGSIPDTMFSSVQDLIIELSLESSSDYPPSWSSIYALEELISLDGKVVPDATWSKPPPKYCWDAEIVTYPFSSSSFPSSSFGMNGYLLREASFSMDPFTSFISSFLTVGSFTSYAEFKNLWKFLLYHP